MRSFARSFIHTFVRAISRRCIPSCLPSRLPSSLPSLLEGSGADGGAADERNIQPLSSSIPMKEGRVERERGRKERRKKGGVDIHTRFIHLPPSYSYRPPIPSSLGRSGILNGWIIHRPSSALQGRAGGREGGWKKGKCLSTEYPSRPYSAFPSFQPFRLHSWGDGRRCGGVENT